MKKIKELIKPYLSIVFGALLVLYYMNFLAGEGASIAIGVIAIVFGALYLAEGILGIIIGDKLPNVIKQIFDIALVAAFPILLFVYFLLFVINSANAILPTGWAILIFSLIASLALPVIYIVSRFIKHKILARFVFLFSATFVLTMLLNVVFSEIGAPIALGGINIVGTVIYVVYTGILFNSLEKAKEEAVEPEVKEDSSTEENNDEDLAKEEPSQEQEEKGKEIKE